MGGYLGKMLSLLFAAALAFSVFGCDDSGGGGGGGGGSADSRVTAIPATPLEGLAADGNLYVFAGNSGLLITVPYTNSRVPAITLPTPAAADLELTDRSSFPSTVNVSGSANTAWFYLSSTGGSNTGTDVYYCSDSACENGWYDWVYSDAELVLTGYEPDENYPDDPTYFNLRLLPGWNVIKTYYDSNDKYWMTNGPAGVTGIWAYY